MNKRTKYESKKRAAAGAAAAVAALGLVTGGLFRSPADLLDEPPDAYLSPSDIPDGNCDGGGDDSVAPEEKRRSVLARLRLRILALPRAVRALVGVPLWAAGWVLISLFSALWSGVLSPVIGTLLQWVCIALLLTLVLAIGIKAAFPDVPLKKILTRRTFGTLALGMLFVGALELVLQLCIPDRPQLVRLISVLSSSLVLASAAVPILVRRPAAAKEDEGSAFSDPEAETRRLVAAIADSYREG